MSRLRTILSRGRLTALAIGILLVIGLTILGVWQSILAPAVLAAPLVFALNQLGQSFVAGISLDIREPFGEGDELSISGSTGRVQRRGLLSVSLDGDDGSAVTVPNAQFVTSIFSVKRKGPA